MLRDAEADALKDLTDIDGDALCDPDDDMLNELDGVALNDGDADRLVDIDSPTL